MTYLCNRNRLTDIKNRAVVAKEVGGGRGRVDWEFRISRCKLLYREWLDNKVPLAQGAMFNIL